MTSEEAQSNTYNESCGDSDYAADLATKTSNVDLSFVDRFSGTLIITGMVADVETSLRAIMDYAERTLKFTVCEITKT